MGCAYTVRTLAPYLYFCDQFQNGPQKIGVELCSKLENQIMIPAFKAVWGHNRHPPKREPPRQKGINERGIWKIWPRADAAGGLFPVRRRFFAGATLEIEGWKTFGTDRAKHWPRWETFRTVRSQPREPVGNL